MATRARLQDHYEKTIRAELQKQFGYKNVMQVPRLEKIVINMGYGRDATANSKAYEGVVKELALITGQKPAVTSSKKSIAGFKLRENLAVGAKVTLRGARMYEFMDRLVNIAMPRIRDFRGLSGRSFDGQGNYAFGIKEHIIFPEINYDRVEKIRGMDVVFTTTAKTNAEAKALLKGFNVPFIN